MVDRETLDLVDMAWMAKRGAWPIAGGVLDQAESFRDAAAFAWREFDYWRTQNNPFAGMTDGD